MHPIEVRAQAGNVWRLLVAVPIAMGLFYYVFGYLPTAFWILGGVLLLVLPFRLLKPPSNEPCVVLDDEGILDKRLQIGVIRWGDVKRAYGYSLQGARYICLDLHNTKQYEARRPFAGRLLATFQRIFGMSAIAISVSGLDLDGDTLLSQIHAGCEAVYQK